MMDNIEKQPKIIVLSYRIFPSESRNYYASVENQLELAYSAAYEIVKDEYVSGMDDGHTYIYHHLIAKRVDAPTTIIRDMADGEVIRTHIVEEIG